LRKNKIQEINNQVILLFFNNKNSKNLKLFPPYNQIVAHIKKTENHRVNKLM